MAPPKKKPESKPETDGIEGIEEPYRPMGVQEPTSFDRLEALELRMTEMEKAISQHNKYHFGGVA